MQLGDLDEVAAGVVEHCRGHRAHVGRRLREPHAETDEAVVLGGDVVDGERRERDAVLDEGFLERPRRGMLVALMAAYAGFNVLSALATSYPLLAVARFLDGLPHGAYFGVASLVAAGLVAPERRGRAVAGVMLGLSVANVLGVPFATWLGENVGWRATYLTAAGLAVITVVGVLAVVPSVPGDSGASGRAEARAVRPVDGVRLQSGDHDDPG